MSQGGSWPTQRLPLPPEAQKLLMKCRLLESEAPRAAALVFAHAAIDGLDDFVQLADTAKLIIGNDNDLAPRGLKKRSPSRILGQFLRVAVELVAVVLDADVQSWPAYIGPTQVLPPGDARQLGSRRSICSVSASEVLLRRDSSEGRGTRQARSP